MRKVKSLRLTRETLRLLELREVSGGVGTSNCMDLCTKTEGNNCLPDLWIGSV